MSKLYMSSIAINKALNYINSFTLQKPSAIDEKISSYTPIEVNKAKKILTDIGISSKDANKMIYQKNELLLTIKPSIMSKKIFKVGFRDIYDLRRYMSIELGFTPYKISSIINKKDPVLNKIYKVEKKDNNETKYVYLDGMFFYGGKGSNNSSLYPNYLTNKEIDIIRQTINDFKNSKKNINDRLEFLEREPEVPAREFNLNEIGKAVDTLRKNNKIKIPKYAVFTKEIANTGMSLEKAQNSISNNDAIRYYDADTVSKMFYQRGFRVSRMGEDGQRDFTWAGKNVQGWDSYAKVDDMWETFGESGRGVKDTDVAFGNTFKGGTKLVDSEFIDRRTKQKIKKILDKNNKKILKAKATGSGKPRTEWYELTLDDFEWFIQNRDKFYNELKEKRMESKKQKIKNKKDLIMKSRKEDSKPTRERLDFTKKNFERNINKLFKKKEYNIKA